jgi:hypothetical protein
MGANRQGCGARPPGGRRRDHRVLNHLGEGPACARSEARGQPGHLGHLTGLAGAPSAFLAAAP